MNLRTIGESIFNTSARFFEFVRVSGSLVIALALFAPFANAHIDLQRAGTHVAKYEQGALGSDTKKGVCGNPDGVATGAVYTYQPGETITISIAEYIPHPGYFRIAFDASGNDNFIDPRWIIAQDPDNRPGGCPIDDTDECRRGVQATDGDFFNNETVLIDNLNPHGRAAAQPQYTWQVALPDVECESCTLQIIQVMEDPAGRAHGVYNTTTQNDQNDVYHQCIDIVLSKDAVPGQAANAAALALTPQAQ